jgi:hypothetical protein
MNHLKYGFADMTCPRPADYRDSDNDYDEDELSDDDSEDTCSDCSGEGCPGCMDFFWDCWYCIYDNSAMTRMLLNQCSLRSNTSSCRLVM